METKRTTPKLGCDFYTTEEGSNRSELGSRNKLTR